MRRVGNRQGRIKASVGPGAVPNGHMSGAMNFGVSRSDAHDALVHCLAGMRKRHQQYNEWMAASAASVLRRDNNSRRS